MKGRAFTYPLDGPKPAYTGVRYLTGQKQEDIERQFIFPSF